MKKLLKFFAVLLCLFVALAIGCSSSSEDETPTKISEVEQTDAPENTTQEKAQEETAVEEKTEYHVGDTILDGDLQIVYVASGEYK